MNEAPRKRRARRIAATAAAAVGAAVLAAPGAATAQTDCAALGDDPERSNEYTAFEIAAECGVEIRISHTSQSHSTLYATPEGQYHLVRTAAPSQTSYMLGGVADPSIVEYGTQLHVDGSGYYFTLPYRDIDRFLFETRTSYVEWDGPVPKPSYSGTTAVFDELAAGLDLSFDFAVGSAELVFTAADAAAWNALSTGLVLDEYYDGIELVAEDGAIRLDNTDYPADTAERTTPFTVRDAAGDVTPVDLALDADGGLTMSLPEGALADAAYPLALTTQWAYRDHYTSEWGAVTSAEPGLALYQGDAGLGTPYFQAAGEAGDIVAGPYCDALADAGCASPAQADAYWNFQGPGEQHIDPGSPGSLYDFAYPVESASFSIDAAGSDCAAPDLAATGEYTPASTYANRPAAVGDPISGACDSGRAVYDVTDAVRDTWDGPGSLAPLTLGMTGAAETARFDGESARLDVYFGAYGTVYWKATSGLCSSALTHTADDTPRYGGFTFESWDWQIIDRGFTWTAEFRDAGTGETVHRTAPHDAEIVAPTAWYSVGDADALPDGRYDVVYAITADTGFTYTAPPCGLRIDTSAPEFLDYEAPGQHYVGEPVAIQVTATDAGFPDGANWLKIGCATGNYDPARGEVTLSRGTTGTCELVPPASDPWLSFWMYDAAGNEASMPTPGLEATWSRNDYNGDGHQDLMTVRRSDGSLLFHAGNGDATFAAGVAEGTGWGGLDIVMAGDVDGDDRDDILARNGATGALYLYPGDGSGGVGTRVQIGTGWNAMGAFTASGDFDYDGNIDLAAVKPSTGSLYLYPGKGDGTFGAAAYVKSQIAYDWSRADSITTPGDIDGDGYDDLLAHDDRTGAYYLYFNNGGSQFHARATVPASLDGTGTDRYTQVVGAGDVDGDNREDLLAVDSRTGELELHSLAEDGTALHQGRTAATAWGGLRLSSTGDDRAYDFDGSGASDIAARRSSTGTTYLYTGNGAGGFLATTSLGTGLSGMNLIETAGDLNGDGFADLIARKTADGTLWLHPGKGDGTLGAAVKIGTGWNSLNAIVSGQDFNGDGRTDVVAREAATGYLWLYPGSGSGGLGARIKIGTGWSAMKEVTAVGDLDHDGIADLIAVRTSDNCMYFYGGKASGGVKSGVQVGCGWAAMDALAAVGDFDGDGRTDLAARRKSDGNLFLYKGDGKGDFTSSVQIGSGWNAMSIIA